jgi:GNAT superfamily N-acetyltransferase
MRVRDACEQDAEEACAVIRRSIIELCILDHQCDPGTLAGWLLNKTTANLRQWIRTHHVLVAEDEGAILGVAAMSASGHVLLNYVSPTARFRGVSRALINVLEARAVSIGLSVLTLESTSTALGFYRAAGYAPAGTPWRRVASVAYPMQKCLPRA